MASLRDGITDDVADKVKKMGCGGGDRASALGAKGEDVQISARTRRGPSPRRSCRDCLLPAVPSGAPARSARTLLPHCFLLPRLLIRSSTEVPPSRDCREIAAARGPGLWLRRRGLRQPRLAGEGCKQTPVGGQVAARGQSPCEPLKKGGAAEARGSTWPHRAPSAELRGHGRGRRRVRAESPSAAGARPGRRLRG